MIAGVNIDVAVVQLVELEIVILVVMGSTPIGHPNKYSNQGVTMKTYKQFLNEIIEKEHGKYEVKTKDGKKTLGTHDSKKSAEKQLAAIEISKAKAK